jgi:AraC-like DNA-binding protein
MRGARDSLLSVSGRLSINRSAFDDPRLSAVAKFVEQSIADRRRVSLTEAARVACLCPQHFSTMFRDRVGICFSVWQSHLRTQHAKLLLTEKTWMQLAAVARAVGYDDLSTFGRVFKRCEALAPHQFRWLAREHPQLRPALLSTGLSAFAYRLVMISGESTELMQLLQHLTSQVELLASHEPGGRSAQSEKTSTKP